MEAIDLTSDTFSGVHRFRVAFCQECDKHTLFDNDGDCWGVEPHPDKHLFTVRMRDMETGEQEVMYPGSHGNQRGIRSIDDLSTYYDDDDDDYEDTDLTYVVRVDTYVIREPVA